MRTTAPSTLMIEVSVEGWFGLPRGTSWLPTRNSATYPLSALASRTPDEIDGCVGSAVKMHVMPIVTSCRASTRLTKSVLLS